MEENKKQTYINIKNKQKMNKTTYIYITVRVDVFMILSEEKRGQRVRGRKHKNNIQNTQQETWIEYKNNLFTTLKQEIFD